MAGSEAGGAERVGAAFHSDVLHNSERLALALVRGAGALQRYCLFKCMRFMSSSTHTKRLAGSLPKDEYRISTKVEIVEIRTPRGCLALLSLAKAVSAILQIPRHDSRAHVCCAYLCWRMLTDAATHTALSISAILSFLVMMRTFLETGMNAVQRINLC